jgi:chemotaxis signal transduction protein
MARLLGRDAIEPRRFVTVRAGDRTIALAFEDVLGVRRLARSDLAELPPVLHAMASDVVAAVGAVDRSVVVLLEAARAITDEQWAALERRGGRE